MKVYILNLVKNKNMQSDVQHFHLAAIISPRAHSTEK